MQKRKKNDNRTEKQKDKRLTIDFWKEVLQGETPPLFLIIRKKTFLNITRLCLEIFGYLIRNGIRSWEHQNGTITPLAEDELKDKLIYLLPIIYEQLNLIRNRTAYFTSLRINSWFKKDYRLRRTLLAMEKEKYIYERDKEGKTDEIALRRVGLSNPHNLIDSTDNPQRDPIEKEDSIIERILDKLENSGKRGPVYRKIMDMLLDGIDVGKDDAEALGVKESQVATLVHQARLKTRKIASEEDQELAAKIDLQVNQIEKKRKLKKIIDLIMLIYIISGDEKMKGSLHLLITNLSSHKVKKSKKNEKKENNRPDNEDDYKKHGPIREWTPKNGWITISYEEALRKRAKVLRTVRKKKALANPEAQIKMPPILDQ
jgi:hypothetical protein